MSTRVYRIKTESGKSFPCICMNNEDREDVKDHVKCFQDKVKEVIECQYKEQSDKGSDMKE